MCGLRLSSHLNALYARKPPTKATIKNKTVFMTIMEGLTAVSLKPITIVRTMIPMTSSMIAELNMVVPTGPFNFPSSCKDATVILTLVAVRMAPILIDSKKAADPIPPNP